MCGLKRVTSPGAPNPGDCEGGWRLREDAWGQGLAKEAAIASLEVFEREETLLRLQPKIRLLGDRVSSGVKLFLLTVAIVDDIIAIAIIAIFYSDGLSLPWLAGAVGALFLVAGLRRAGVTAIAIYAILGLGAWLAMHESGVHATIAGVALGLLTPARPVAGRPVLETLEHRLHPVTAFAVYVTWRYVHQPRADDARERIDYLGVATFSVALVAVSCLLLLAPAAGARAQRLARGPWSTPPPRIHS